MKHIGWIGLGNMGTPMASNLSKAGFPLTVVAVAQPHSKSKI